MIHEHTRVVLLYDTNEHDPSNDDDDDVTMSHDGLTALLGHLVM